MQGLVTAVHAGDGNRRGSSPFCVRRMRDPALRVGYRRPGQRDFVDGSGTGVTGRGVPIRLGAHEIGTIVSGTGRAPVPEEVAREAALVAESTRLRGELGHALAEVEASRQRLLRAGYEERRRLEMDLHDGAQQRLVSLGMRLRVAQRRVRRRGAVEVDELVDSRVEEIATAVAELRQIAHGLRPSSLDDGLARPWSS